MGTMARDAGGRRLYTAEFKRQQLARVERGELTASELSRELGIARSRSSATCCATARATGIGVRRRS